MRKCFLYLPLLVFFVPGCWEMNYSLLCVLWRLFCLVLYAVIGSFLTHTCSTQSQTRGNPSAVIWNFFYAAPSSHFAMQFLGTLASLSSKCSFPNSASLLGSELPYFPLCHGLKILPVVSWGTCRTYHICLLFSGVTLPSLYCPVSKNHYFIYFI